MTDSNKKLVVLTGPTAVGKTALSIQLAKTSTLTQRLHLLRNASFYLLTNIIS